jgi:hypothetical protein
MITFVILTSIFNQPTLLGAPIPNPEDKNLANPHGNTFAGEKLPHTIIFDPYELAKMKQLVNMTK